MSEEIELDEISKQIFNESLAAVEKRIYFKIVKGAEGCPSDKPYGVVGEKSGFVHGCHPNQASAAKQLKSIYAATSPKSGYKPASKQTRKDMETPQQHQKRLAREAKKSGMKNGMKASADMLTPRQEFMYEAYEAAVETFGMFNQGPGPDGAHYGPGKVNPFKSDNLMCQNCSFYEGDNACELVEGVIDPEGICKLWIIEESILLGDTQPGNQQNDQQPNDQQPSDQPMQNQPMNQPMNNEGAAAEMFAIPEAVKTNAQKGLELRKQFGRGGTGVGENTARILAAGGSIGIEKVKHINRYFPRHAGDNLSDKTSNGWIAWLLWGGDSAWTWTKRVISDYEAKQKLDGAKMFSPERRMKLAKEGIAMPDGSYPIVTVGDLKNAIKSFGLAKDQQKAKDHIINRAKVLKAEDLIPAGWMK